MAFSVDWRFFGSNSICLFICIQFDVILIQLTYLVRFHMHIYRVDAKKRVLELPKI